MLWQDEGVVLAVRRHGENSAVASLLTREHGRHAGLVKGGMSKRQRPLWQPGNRLQVTWRARLAEHLGQFVAEPISLVAVQLIDDPDRLAGLASACALLEVCLAERDSHPRLYDDLIGFLGVLVENDQWLEHYVAFELALLAELGFGLDLAACAVTGASENLAYVSPASGRAVTRAGAGVYVDRLLPLPPFLIGEADADAAQILSGLRLTGAFLRRHVFDATDRAMPGSRERLIARLTRKLQTPA
jgi:DNA repair protein RecO (recombination protein O)